MKLKSNKLFLVSIIIVLTFSLNIFAKNSSKSSQEILELLKNISESYNKINSLKADFTQIKTSKLLKEVAITEGNISFKKPDLMLLNFNDPYHISIFLKDKKVIKIDKKQKIYSTISLKKQKSNLMNFLNISKTFQFLDQYFYIEKVNTKGKLIYIICIPKKRRTKKKLKIVELWLDPVNYIFKKIKIEEPDNTITEIRLKNIKIDTKIEDNLFTYSLKNMEKKEWRQ